MRSSSTVKALAATSVVLATLSSPAQAGSEPAPQGGSVDFIGGYTLAFDQRWGAKGSVFPENATCTPPIRTDLVSGSILQQGPDGAAGMVVNSQCVERGDELVARYRAHLLVPGQDITIKRKVMPLDQLFVRIDHGPDSLSVRVSNKTRGWSRREETGRFEPESHTASGRIVSTNQFILLHLGDLTLGGVNFGLLEPTKFQQGGDAQCTVGGFEANGTFFGVAC